MRASTRFKPDPLEYALIDFKDEKNAFAPDTVGLIMNESYAGCSLVIKTNEPIIPHRNLRVQVGKLSVMPAKIIWVKVLEETVVQFGIQFLE